MNNKCSLLPDLLQAGLPRHYKVKVVTTIKNFKTSHILLTVAVRFMTSILRLTHFHTILHLQHHMTTLTMRLTASYWQSANQLCLVTRQYAVSAVHTHYMQVATVDQRQQFHVVSRQTTRLYLQRHQQVQTCLIPNIMPWT